jgi:hypothetical protein
MLGMMRVVTNERDFELINDDRSLFSGKDREGASGFLPNTPFILLMLESEADQISMALAVRAGLSPLT